MKKLLFLMAVVAIATFVTANLAEARGRYGSFRVGGYTSSGKGSHYIGGYTRSCQGWACR